MFTDEKDKGFLSKEKEEAIDRIVEDYEKTFRELAK